MSKRKYRVTVIFEAEFSRKIRNPRKLGQMLFKGIKLPKSLAKFKKVSFKIRSEIIKPPKPPKPKRYVPSEEEAKALALLNDIAQRLALIVKCKKPKIVLANVKGSHCKGVSRMHIHVGRYDRWHGHICITRKHLMKLMKDPELRKKELIHEIGHLRMPKRRPSSKKFREFEKRMSEGYDKLFG